MGSEEDSESEDEENPGRPNQQDFSKLESQPPVPKKKSGKVLAEPEEKSAPPLVFNTDLYHQPGTPPPLVPVILSSLLTLLFLVVQKLAMPRFRPRLRPPYFPQHPRDMNESPLLDDMFNLR